jgi:hypothetical protein
MARVPYPKLTEHPAVGPFYRSFGVALSAWHLVEEGIWGVYESAVAPKRSGSALCAYHSLQFRAKLAVTDAAVRFALVQAKAPHSLVEEWERLHRRTGKLNRARNHFAHFQIVWFSGVKNPRRCVRLVPANLDWRYYAEILGYVEYTVDDLDTITRSFSDLALKLRDFSLKIPPPRRRRKASPQRVQRGLASGIPQRQRRSKS